MKGIIFNAVEKAVVELFDEDTWDDLVEEAGVSGSYTALGTYPDAELIALVHAACKTTGMSADEIMQTLGRYALPRLVDQVEELVDRSVHVFDFLGTIHDIIHVEVRKLAPDAETPEILTQRLDDETLEVRYRSRRNLPALAHGLILGAGDMYHQELDIAVVSSTEAETIFAVQCVEQNQEVSQVSPAVLQNS